LIEYPGYYRMLIPVAGYMLLDEKVGTMYIILGTMMIYHCIKVV